MVRFLFLTLFLSLSAFADEGKFHVFLKDFYGSEVHVFLPPDYEKSETRYPVLYMHDGQNLYDPTRAYLGQTWNAEITLNQLIQKKQMLPLIVVAIDNTRNRMNDYTYDVDPGVGQGGEADRYLQRLIFDLKPYVDRQLRTLRERKFTGIMGSSLGGLVSLYAGVRYAETFGLVGALSPSIWWNQKSIKGLMASSGVLPLKLYLDSGTEGGERPQDVDELAGMLSPRLSPEKLRKVIGEGDNHSENAWAKRLPYALIHLYGRQKNRH